MLNYKLNTWKSIRKKTYSGLLLVLISVYMCFM